ncbi:MAG: hypothetical protein AAF614_21565, partial [Chloroflexota bacterium]
FYFLKFFGLGLAIGLKRLKNAHFLPPLLPRPRPTNHHLPANQGETNGGKAVLERIRRRLPSPYDYWGANDSVFG